MKSIIEQVDRFIEGIMEGSIITVLSSDIDHNGKTLPYAVLMGQDEGTRKNIRAGLTTLYNELIPTYVIATDEEQRQKLAEAIFDIVIRLRLIGFVKNNPDNSKELNYYKDRCRMLEEREKELAKQVKDLGTQILQMSQLAKDEKVGVT